MIFSYSTLTALAAPVQGRVHAIQSGDWMDKLHALEKQNSRLQELVCYLLQKNEALRTQVETCRENGGAEA